MTDEDTATEALADEAAPTESADALLPIGDHDVAPEDDPVDAADEPEAGAADDAEVIEESEAEAADTDDVETPADEADGPPTTADADDVPSPPTPSRQRPTTRVSRVSMLRVPTAKTPMMSTTPGHGLASGSWCTPSRATRRRSLPTSRLASSR